MGFSKPLYNLPVLITLTIGTSVLTACFVFWQLWTLLPVILLLLVLVVIRLCKLYSHNTKKITLMLDAINNNDYTFKYVTDGYNNDDSMISKSLNRITQILFQAKAEVVQREKYYELILNNVRTGIIVVDEDGNIYQSNREALRLLGISILTHVKQLKKADSSLADTVKKIHAGEKLQVSFSNERGMTNLSIHASDILLKEKHLKIIAINDINNEMEDKEIDSWIRLIRVLTHEIMNAITPITSLSNTLLSMEGNISEDVRDGLQTISTTGKGLISFVESYRKFTHVPTPQPSLFYLDRFLKRMVQLAQYHDKSSNIKFLTDVQPDDMILYADENLISQVILNLLKNATQAIGNEKQDGWIRLKAYCNEEEDIIIEVSNNGPTIPKEEAENIFIPFFTTKENGSGIGLSISRQIMRVSGGSLTLKNPSSTTPYTTFVLKF